MPVLSTVFKLHTKGFCDIHDITARVDEFIRKCALHNGIVTVFVPGSTASVTTIEFESGAIEDLKRAIERIAPTGIEYAHDTRWGDGNGFAHIRAALLGPSLSIPLVDGDLRLGTWQQIVLIDFDNRPRQREIVVQAVGE